MSKCDMEFCLKTYLEIFIPIIAIILAYLFGKSAYYRQKEYELITERYLKEGIDRTTKQIEKSLGIFRHNWARALTVIKMFRDAGKDIDPDLHQSGFIEPDPSILEIWVDYRVNELVGSKVFHNTRQHLAAFTKTSYDFCAFDISTLIRLYSEEGKELRVEAERSVLVKEYLQELMEMDKEASKYYVLINELQRIAGVLQTQRFSFKGIKKFKKNKTIKKSIETLERLFPEQETR